MGSPTRGLSLGEWFVARHSTRSQLGARRMGPSRKRFSMDSRVLGWGGRDSIFAHSPCNYRRRSLQSCAGIRLSLGTRLLAPDGQSFAWRTGYWYRSYPNWFWTPNHYDLHTTCSLLISGYWDYPLSARGFLYASVYWNRGLHGSRSRYVYRPCSIVITVIIIMAMVDRQHFLIGCLHGEKDTTHGVGSLTNIDIVMTHYGLTKTIT